MTDRPQPAADTAAEAEDVDRRPTLVEPITGNYFVSAYPPFFYWSEDEAPAALAALQHAPADTGAPEPPPHGR